MQKDFSYPVKIENLNQQQQHFHLVADSKDLRTLKEILKVEDAKSFTADIDLKLNLKAHRLDIWGRVQAVLELQSVISLENFEQAYDIPFEYFYDTQATYQDIRQAEYGIDDEVPDIIENGQIDLGSVAIERLALAMDDYPRQEGEVFCFESEFDAKTTEQARPFAVLQKLKK
jgi:uncharacterized metal-binding protein YceD (DUF177 family)